MKEDGTWGVLGVCHTRAPTCWRIRRDSRVTVAIGFYTPSSWEGDTSECSCTFPQAFPQAVVSAPSLVQPACRSPSPLVLWGSHLVHWMHAQSEMMPSSLCWCLCRTHQAEHDAAQSVNKTCLSPQEGWHAGSEENKCRKCLQRRSSACLSLSPFLFVTLSYLPCFEYGINCSRSPALHWLHPEHLVLTALGSFWQAEQIKWEKTHHKIPNIFQPAPLCPLCSAGICYCERISRSWTGPSSAASQQSFAQDQWRPTCLGTVSASVQHELCFAWFFGMAKSIFQGNLENICSSQARPAVGSAVDTWLQLHWTEQIRWDEETPEVNFKCSKWSVCDHSESDFKLKIHLMSTVCREVPSLNHEAPVGGWLLSWSFSFTSSGIVLWYRNTCTVSYWILIIILFL